MPTPSTEPEAGTSQRAPRSASVAGRSGRPVPPGPATQRGEGQRAQNGPSLRLGKVVALGIVIVGVGAALFIVHNVRSQTPFAQTTPIQAMPKPASKASAIRDVLDFVPRGTGSSGLVVTAGVSIEKALEQATGPDAALKTTGPAALSYIHARAVRLTSGTYVVSFSVPVHVRTLEKVGAVAGPGTDLRVGDLRVSYDGRAVYAIRMNPRTRDAVFRFALAGSGQRLTSLNWNAMALITQTDASDTLGF